VESLLKAALREILCASLSLDDGLSTIQNLAVANTKNSDVFFEVARAIEEILLRRPSPASAKLTELGVRLSTRNDSTLRDMIMLLDTRYTTVHHRAEVEIAPDVEAIPRLLEMLADLEQGITTAINLNLRPLLPFLSDELIMTLEALHARSHEASIRLAAYEAHHTAWILSESGIFDCADAILNQLMNISDQMGFDKLGFESTLDEAAVLTELGMYDESRKLLVNLLSQAEEENDPIQLAMVTLQKAINETRDDSIPHDQARSTANEAARMFQDILDYGGLSEDGLGLVHLVIGSNILASGWREAVPQALDGLEKALKVFGSIEEMNETQRILHFRTLAGLGFSYGMMGYDDNTVKGLEYLERAKTVLQEIDNHDKKFDIEIARCNHAIGWLCLSCESDEHFERGRQAFERAIEAREKFLEQSRVSELVVLGTKLGIALLELRHHEDKTLLGIDQIQDVLVRYVPLFPIDPRSFTEIAIATYDVVWTLFRHGLNPSQRLLRFFDDIDRMLRDTRVGEDSVFIQGVSLIVPFLNGSWSQLSRRANDISKEGSELSDIAQIMGSLAKSKINLEATNLEAGLNIQSEISQNTIECDSLLGNYWSGQRSLASTVKSYYENRDYEELASGLYEASLQLKAVASIRTSFAESSEFISATAISLAEVLMDTAEALSSTYSIELENEDAATEGSLRGGRNVDFILPDDWLGLLKITKSYVEMIENSDRSHALSYLNAIFSNISRALRMMDNIALIDRRVLSRLGEAMNRRYYLRK
jgi:tetratricopeptide (TPR) repeat protein